MNIQFSTPSNRKERENQIKEAIKYALTHWRVLLQSALEFRRAHKTSSGNEFNKYKTIKIMSI